MFKILLIKINILYIKLGQGGGSQNGMDRWIGLRGQGHPTHAMVAKTETARGQTSISQKAVAIAAVTVAAGWQLATAAMAAATQQPWQR